MARKIYNSIYFQFMTFVDVAGTPTILEFKGGVAYGNFQQAGSFSTSDKALQKAIESDPRFGKEFFLVQVEGDSTPPQNVVTQTPKRKEIVVENLQEAKEYLAQQGIPLQSLKSKEEVLRRAEECGVTFPSLQL